MEVDTGSVSQTAQSSGSSPTPQLNAPTSGTPSQAQPLSKNAQKKLVKAARIAEQKKERRAAEKARRKERKRIQAENRAVGELDGDDGGDGTGGSRKRRRVEKSEPFDARVVVDLGFDDMMTDQEIKSLVSQMAYTYSANRKAERPFSSLLFTSLNGRTLARLESLSDAAYKRWTGSEFWTEGYERLWEERIEEEGTEVDVSDREDDARAETSRAVAEGPGNVHKTKGKCSLPKPQCVQRQNVVYLTADSEEELTELKESETYIIGGIVDHNRYKVRASDRIQQPHADTIP